jgi:hypothetical protein
MGRGGHTLRDMGFSATHCLQGGLVVQCLMQAQHSGVGPAMLAVARGVGAQSAYLSRQVVIIAGGGGPMAAQIRSDHTVPEGTAARSVHFQLSCRVPSKRSCARLACGHVRLLLVK